MSPTIPIALAITCLAVGCSRPEPPRSEVVRPVKTMVVIAGDEAHVRVFPGRVKASMTAQLAFRVSGRLTRLPVKEGQHVTKGEVIAQLRQDEFQAVACLAPGWRMSEAPGWRMSEPGGLCQCNRGPRGPRSPGRAFVLPMPRRQTRSYNRRIPLPVM